MEKNVIKIEDFSSYFDEKQSVKIEGWRITRIEIPICLKDDSNEIVEMIKDAFITRDKELLPLVKAEYQFGYIASPDFY